MDNEKKNAKKKDYMIIVYFILIVIAWSSIDSLHNLFKSNIIKSFNINSFIYSVISFIIGVSILFCFNGFTLIDCGLI